MNPPEAILKSVGLALEARLGRPTRISRASPVGGGCINPSARLETETGESFFLKWNNSAPGEMFEAEADGLRFLARGASASGIAVPEVLGLGGSGSRENPGWLLMQFIPQGSPTGEYGRRLGEGLALLHASAGAAHGQGSPTHVDPIVFGWHRDNFIGSLPQANQSEMAWSSFWRDQRLEPQLRMARDGGFFRGSEGQAFDDLLDRMDELLGDACPGGPSLLHGDLWSGNYYPGPQGDPVLIDPAVYRGHGEVDLSMMELFGSLPRGFREGYAGVSGLTENYEAFRRDLYQLYYLLVHVNLFGGGYAGGSLAAARRVLAGAS